MSLQLEEKRILSLFLLDGIQVSALLTVLSFLLFATSNDDQRGLAVALPLGLGLGMIGTFLVGMCVDSMRPNRILQLVQGTQALLCLATLGWSLANVPIGFACSATLALAFARCVGPAKDKLLSQYISQRRRTHVNALTRRWFLVLNEASVAFCTVTLTLLPRNMWPLLLLLSVGGILCSLVVAASLGKMLPEPSMQRQGLVPIGKERCISIIVALTIIAFLSIGSALPSVGLAAWITWHDHYPPWTVSALGVCVLSADFFCIKYLNKHLEQHPGHWRWLHRFGALLIAAAVSGIWCTTQTSISWLTLFTLVLALVCAAVSFSVAVMIAMEVQYGFGHHGMRGRIASYTRMSATAGSALSTALAPAIFLSVPLICVVLGIVTLLALVPWRYTLIDPRKILVKGTAAGPD